MLTYHCFDLNVSRVYFCNLLITGFKIANTSFPIVHKHRIEMALQFGYHFISFTNWNVTKKTLENYLFV